MCPPTYFFAEKGAIDYKINRWMKRGRPVSVFHATLQWHKLKQALDDLGCRVELIAPRPGLSDFVFTANYALVHNKIALISRFRHSQRQLEETFIRLWFLNQYSRGLIDRIAYTPENISFEGQGDAFFVSGKIFLGHGNSRHFRTDRESHDIVSAVFGLDVVSLQLADPRFCHLDMCFRPLSDSCALYYPFAFDNTSRETLQKHIKDLVKVTHIDALKFVCNSVVVGNNVIMGAEPTKKLRCMLQKRGFTVMVTPLDEFFKSGGSAQCLVLFL